MNVNQAHVQEELLNRYFDGDLHGSQATDVEQHLGGCDACSARHRELSQLRKMIEATAEDAMRGVDFNAIYGEIERGIREPRSAPGVLERLSVWVRDLSEQRPARLWVPIAGGLAAAIVLGMLLRRGGPAEQLPQAENQVEGDPAAEVTEGSAREAAEAAPDQLRESEAIAAVSSSEIVQVDFGSSAGTVYEISLANGVSTPVVWINDDVQ